MESMTSIDRKMNIEEIQCAYANNHLGSIIISKNDGSKVRNYFTNVLTHLMLTCTNRKKNFTNYITDIIIEKNCLYDSNSNSIDFLIGTKDPKDNYADKFTPKSEVSIKPEMNFTYVYTGAIIKDRDSLQYSIPIVESRELRKFMDELKHPKSKKLSWEYVNGLWNAKVE